MYDCTLPRKGANLKPIIYNCDTRELFKIHVIWAWSYQQKKSEKFPEFGSDFWFLENSILSKILGSYFQKSGQLAAPKNQIWFFSDFSKKIWGFKIFRFIRKKNLDLRIFVGRIEPWYGRPNPENRINRKPKDRIFDQRTE